MASPLLVLGTRNRKKGLELLELLAPLGLDVKTLADYPDSIEIDEDRDTFQGNATKKAVDQALHLKQWVLGEDSGLSVHALKGEPGVFSARYSGPGATDEKNNQKLIAALEGVPLEKRGAHYTCYAVLSDPRGQVRFECHGECHGRILSVADGEGGFGYDPYFEIVEYHMTFGRLAPAVKRALSHRGRALRQLVPEIGRILSADEWK